jgi:hypothetical protein
LRNKKLSSMRDSYATFLSHNTDVLDILKASALRYLACICMDLIADASTTSTEDAEPLYVKLGKRYQGWARRVRSNIPLHTDIDDFTRPTLELMAQVTNPTFPQEYYSNVRYNMFSLFHKWGWQIEDGFSVHEWHDFHLFTKQQRPDVKMLATNQIRLEVFDIDEDEPVPDTQRMRTTDANQDPERASYEKELSRLVDSSSGCFECVLKFMSTMGNRLSPNRITTAQYHPWWIEKFQEMVRVWRGVQRLDRVSALEAFITRVCSHFPIQILGASELLTLGMIIYEGRGAFCTFKNDLEALRLRNVHHKTQGWYVFDSYYRRPDALALLIQKGEVMRLGNRVGQVIDFDLEHDVEPFSRLYPYSYPRA